jgi:hypothetical protein
MRADSSAVLGAVLVLAGCGSTDSVHFSSGANQPTSSTGGAQYGAGGATGAGGFQAGSGGFAMNSGGVGTGGMLGNGGGFGGASVAGAPSGGATGAGGTAAHFPSGGIVTEKCSACADQNCQTELAACDDDPQCVSGEQCVSTCTAIAACANCALSAGASFRTLFTSCINLKCGTLCPSIN